MFNIDSRLNISLRKQRHYEKQTMEAESVLESQFGESVYRRIIESPCKTLPIRQRKFHIRTKGDPKRIIAWAIAQRVREAREKQGLRQEDLAEKTGIARSNITRLERGRHLPTLPTLQKIARALNLDLNNLMTQPVVTQKDRLEFKEMAEIGIAEWEKQLEDKDTKD